MYRTGNQPCKIFNGERNFEKNVVNHKTVFHALENSKTKHSQALAGNIWLEEIEESSHRY
jgi:hypothetical protein